MSVDTLSVCIEDAVLQEMTSLGESGYPEEVAGFLLGSSQANKVVVQHFVRLANAMQPEARHYSYQVSATDWQGGEATAKKLTLELVGIFHTHPDHPSLPSLFDLEFALPNFIYIIATIRQRSLTSMQAWKLCEDRSRFDSCLLQLEDAELLKQLTRPASSDI